MSQDLVLVLLQVVALTLPAVGIYLQVLRDIHKPDPQDDIRVDSTNMMLDFNLAKIGLLVVTISGLFDIVYLVILQIPPLGTGLGSIALTALLLCSLLLIGFGIFLFSGSVYFSFGISMTLSQNPSMWNTISMFLRLLYRMLHPRKQIGPNN